MRKNYPYLKDSAFLQVIDKLQNKEQYVRITLLDFVEKPIRTIQGQVISGSINLDGTSSIRRTCNLTMVAQEYENDLTNVNNLISINKKVDLEIGILNTTEYYSQFPIIWFPLGIYVIINPSISSGTSGVTISLQLKDKMCLLNKDNFFSFSTLLSLVHKYNQLMHLLDIELHYHQKIHTNLHGKRYIFYFQLYKCHF